MGLREIPVSFEHKCDGCGKVVLRNAPSRPLHWSQLTVGRDAYDFQGADASIKRLLCEECSDTVLAAINASLTKAHVPS